MTNQNEGNKKNPKKLWYFFKKVQESGFPTKKCGNDRNLRNEKVKKSEYPESSSG